MGTKFWGDLLIERKVNGLKKELENFLKNKTIDNLFTQYIKNCKLFEDKGINPDLYYIIY